MPEPVAPTTATVLPGGISKEMSVSTSVPSMYEKWTFSKRTLPGSPFSAPGRGVTSLADTIDGSVSSTWKIRSAEAKADCSTL